MLVTTNATLVLVLFVYFIKFYPSVANTSIATHRHSKNLGKGGGGRAKCEVIACKACNNLWTGSHTDQLNHVARLSHVSRTATPEKRAQFIRKHTTV